MELLLENIKNFCKIYFVDTIKNFDFIFDTIDILLLTFIIFFVYRFIRERRAGKLLIGLGCVLAFSIIGASFDMHATTLVFGNFTQIGVLAILIIFQPELRSALEKVGGISTGIRNITTEQRDASARSAEIDALCTAVSDMSRDKVGALIVIERTTKLGEYIKSGVSIDASLSAHLIRNLFFNKAPLHDGAVIIRNGRICAAGCFLPLSTKEDINKDLGTRHRAAIGLSEISDAIVIIVSEETGTVSISTNGNLERNYNYSSLKQELNKLLAPEGQGERKEHQKKRTKKEKRSRYEKED